MYVYKVTYLDITFFIGYLFLLKSQSKALISQLIFCIYCLKLFSLVKDFLFNKISFDAGLFCGEVTDSAVAHFWFRFDTAVFAGIFSNHRITYCPQYTV